MKGQCKWEILPYQEGTSRSEEEVEEGKNGEEEEEEVKSTVQAAGERRMLSSLEPSKARPGPRPLGDLTSGGQPHSAGYGEQCPAGSEESCWPAFSSHSPLLWTHCPVLPGPCSGGRSEGERAAHPHPSGVRFWSENALALQVLVHRTKRRNKETTEDCLSICHLSIIYLSTHLSTPYHP